MESEPIQAIEKSASTGGPELGEERPEEELDANQETVRVVVRVRPSNANEASRPDGECLQCAPDGQTLLISPKRGDAYKPMTFHAVFGPDTSQDDFFSKCGLRRLVDRALGGYSCTAFAFGQTGSGKTHTITGPPDPTEGGLVQRAIYYLFDQVASQPTVKYTLQTAFFEIYNEQVLDLLNTGPHRSALGVRWRPDRGFYVENLYVMQCHVVEEMLGCLEEGLRSRATASHEMNERSSRSHSIFTVYITANRLQDDGTTLQTSGKLCIVDLAGSERVKHTKAEGAALIESGNINKSLLALGSCISALADHGRATHIPYRDSALTMLLKDSLGGTGVALMCACVSPSFFSASETISTLRYAGRAKRIKNRPIIQCDPQQQLILSLRREVQILKAEVETLRGRLADRPSQVAFGGDLQAARAAVETRLLSAGSTGPDRIQPMTRELMQMRMLLQQCMQDNEDLRQANSTLVGQLSDLRLRGDPEASFAQVSQRSRALIDKSSTLLSRELQGGDFFKKSPSFNPEGSLTDLKSEPSGSSKGGYANNPRSLSNRMQKGSYARRPHSDPTRVTAALASGPPSPAKAAAPAGTAAAGLAPAGYSRSPSQASHASSYHAASSSYGSGSFSVGQPLHTSAASTAAVPGGPPSFLPSTSALSNDSRPHHMSFNMQLRNELDMLDVELNDAQALASASAPPAQPAQRKARK